MTTRKNFSVNPNQSSSESLLKDIRCNTKRIFTSEQKVLIVMEGIRGEHSIAEHEDGKDKPIIGKQHDAEHHKGEKREHNTERLLCQKRVYTVVVAHALHQVAHQFGVEEGHR